MYGLVGIGVDSNSVNTADVLIHGGGSAMHVPARATIRSILTPGCHDFFWLEAINGSGTVIYYGAAFTNAQSAISAVVMM